MRPANALYLLVLLLLAAPSAQAQSGSERPKNVILFVADGTGPASFTMARDFVRFTDGTEALAIDSILVGSIRTYATDSRVTDSAAGATAFSAGVKTYNGAIAVDTLQQPVATLLEAAEARGMATGLVATSRITHATPASFAAHVRNRGMEVEIAEQQMQHEIEVILGGGFEMFVPQEAGGERTDGRNLLDEAIEQGYTLVRDRAGFDALDATPVLGLFTPSHMAYEIDRDPAEEPSLAEMTAKAIALLRDDPDGFFLMVEGSRIDHAAHANDAAAHLHDILAYDEAIAVATTFARENGETLIVSTSDHETGGLTIGRDGAYTWEPSVLAGVTASLQAIGAAYQQEQQPICDLLAEVTAFTCTEEERVAFAASASADDVYALAPLVMEAISARAGLGWTTLGHTGVDVNLYAFGPGHERFRGHHDNTAVGTMLADLLGLDLAALTQTLRAAMGSQ